MITIPPACAIVSFALAPYIYCAHRLYAVPPDPLQQRTVKRKPGCAGVIGLPYYKPRCASKAVSPDGLSDRSEVVHRFKVIHEQSSHACR